MAAAFCLCGCTRENSTAPGPAIPYVEGIRVAYDTAAGIATLRWKPVSHALLQDYMVFRDEGANAPPSTPSIGYSVDTVFRDTLWLSAPGSPGKDGAPPFAYSDSGSRSFTWRVRARLRTQEAGQFLNSATTQALSPSWVSTTAEARLEGPHGNTVTIRDTMPLVIRFRNPLRRVKTIRWYDDESKPPLRTVSPGAREGADTLAYRSGSSPSVSNFYVRLEDESGALVRATVSIRVIDDKPKAALSTTLPLSIINVGDPIHLKGSAADAGRIVKWEYAQGSGADFVPVANPDTVLAVTLVPPAHGTLYWYLRATDEDGNMDTARLDLDLVPWKNLKRMPTPRMDFTATALGGKIYVLGGFTSVTQGEQYPKSRIPSQQALRTLEAYDPATDTWKSLAPMKRERIGHRAIALGAKLLVTGGRGFDNRPISSTEVYDPAADTWSEAGELDHGKSYFGLARQGGRIYAMEGFRNDEIKDTLIEVYDPALDRWIGTRPKQPSLDSLSALRTRLYRDSADKIEPLINQLNALTREPDYDMSTAKGLSDEIRRLVRLYDDSLDAVSAKMKALTDPYPRAWAPVRAHSFGGKLLVAGDDQGRGQTKFLDFVTGEAIVGKPIRECGGCASAVYGDKLVSAGRSWIGGYDPFASWARFDGEQIFDAYDPEDGTAHVISYMRPKRTGGEMIEVDRKVYLIGGYNLGDRMVSDLLQVYALPLDSVLADP